MVEHLPNVPSEIIELTLINCQNKNKVSNVMAYDVTVEFIWKYKDTLAPAVGKVNVRFSVLKYMAELYDYSCENERNDLILKVVEKYPKYILEHYWVYEKQLNKERLTVIQLLNKYIVPYSMSPDQRMKRLLKVLAALDTRSCFTLAKIKHQQHIHSKHLLDVIRFVKESIKGDDSMKNIAMLKSMALCHHIPLPFETALQSVVSFARKLSQDDQEAELITNVLDHKSLEEINDILESLKANRNYSNEFTWILELSSDWLFDESSYKVLTVTCLSSCHDRELMCRFMSWFRMTKDQSVKIHVLKVLTLLQSEDEELTSKAASSAYESTNTLASITGPPSTPSYVIKYPEVMNELILTCQELCTTSDTTMAKWCIRSLMIAEPKREELSHYLLSLVQVIDKVIIREESSSDASSFSFTHPSLSIEIKARYFKFLAQCAFEGGAISYDDVLELLFEVIEKEVDSPAPSSPSIGEKAWMRLAAGCAVLRVLRAGSMDMLTRHQFYLLSDLMIDEVAEVAEVFSNKLRTALWCDYPTITMPPELLSLFILIDVDDSDVEADEKKAIAELFAKGDQGNRRASNMDEKEDSEIESYQSEDENNSVVLVGEGTMTTEDMDDEISVQIDENTTFERGAFHARRSSRKRKISEV
ncbi:sister chromatid cohesion protein PDS5 homolog B-like [Hetaerina americana]|uniref:sister chromatid cohesion protein PDS5 homolog B-like n=1 Tax=Hetaerina americana TaxID=62018 RepID=UPI003A7F1E6B